MTLSKIQGLNYHVFFSCPCAQKKENSCTVRFRKFGRTGIHLQLNGFRQNSPILLLFLGQIKAITWQLDLSHTIMPMAILYLMVIFQQKGYIGLFEKLTDRQNFISKVVLRAQDVKLSQSFHVLNSAVKVMQMCIWIVTKSVCLHTRLYASYFLHPTRSVGSIPQYVPGKPLSAGWSCQIRAVICCVVSG